MSAVLNPSSLPAPPELPSDGAGIEKKIEVVQVTVGGKAINVHTVQTSSKPAEVGQAFDVLFLHSGALSSQDWLDNQTLDHVTNWGHRAVAIDLPGRGKTTDKITEGEEVDFLSAIIDQLALTKIVFVSPSSSGKYTLPYLFTEPKTSVDRAAGFVPVAPAKTEVYREQYSHSQVSTLIVYGTNDPRGPESLNNLCLLPRHEVAALEGAGHPCYLDDPEIFHKVLYHFLQSLSVS